MRRRRIFANGSKGTEDINISPLIDMVFILLIFFIVTTVFVEETGVEVTKPQAASASQLEKNSILIAITANRTHSIVGAAAPMDIGGKKMAGFASGVIDSFQYYGSALSLFITGRVLDATKDTYGWNFWFIIMTGFAATGGFAMLALLLRQKGKQAAMKLVVFALAAAILFGLTFGTYKYRQIVKENAAKPAAEAPAAAAPAK